jgi:23S rRNA pseudouridine1911/1915/1917 synthase
MGQRQPLDVLYEDNHLLVVNKPVGLATQGVTEGTPSALAWAKTYLKHKYNKPGNVYVGVVSRLDALVGGVLVFARTSKAAARLTRQFQSGGVEKIYWALVERPPEPAAGELAHWLRKNDKLHKIEVVPPRTGGAQQARLSYRTLGRRGKHALLEICLHTGRKHQIRVQLAAIGRPIIGDRKYGSRLTTATAGIALHCVRLSLEHPISRQRLTFTAQWPEEGK